MKAVKYFLNYIPVFYLLFFLSLSQIALSQKDNETFYLFKSNWQRAKDITKAAYFMQLIKEDDTTYTCRYYNKYGPMIRQETYLDSDLTIANGRFCWYDTNGNLDSTVMVYRRKKDGVWNYYDDSLNPVVSIEYDKGIPINHNKVLNANFSVTQNETHENGTEKIPANNGFVASDNNEKIRPPMFGDFNDDSRWGRYLEKNISMPKRFLTVLKRNNYEMICSFCVDKEGATTDIFLMRSIEWSADNEVINAITNSPKWNAAMEDGYKVDYRQKLSIDYQVFYSSNDTLVTPISYFYDDDNDKMTIRASQIPAMFPEGVEGWQSYLQHSLNYSITIQNNAPPGDYTVEVSFLIDKEGNIKEVTPLNNPGFGTAEEFVRVIKNGPRWIPAMQNGKSVIYRQKQSVTFQVSLR